MISYSRSSYSVENRIVGCSSQYSFFHFTTTVSLLISLPLEQH